MTIEFFSIMLQKPKYRNELINSFSSLPDDAFDSKFDKLQLFIIKRLNRLNEQQMEPVIKMANLLFSDPYIDNDEFFGKKDIDMIDHICTFIGTISFILTAVTTDDDWDEAVILVKRCMRFSISDFIHIPKYTDELQIRIENIEDDINFNKRIITI